MRIDFRLCLALLLLVAAPLLLAAGKISVLGLFKDRAIVEIDGKQQLLKAGQARDDGIKLISANSKEAVIEVDGKQSTYTMGSQISTHFVAPAAGASVQIAPDVQGMYFVNGTVNGYSVRFLVDTGATMVAMNKHQAKRMGIDYKLDSQEGLSQTASGTVKAYYISLKKVTVGDITLNDVPAGVLDGDYPTEILLGNSFLSRLDLQREGPLLRLQKK